MPDPDRAVGPDGGDSLCEGGAEVGGDGRCRDAEVSAGDIAAVAATAAAAAADVYICCLW